jgi:hypothetical protein
MWRKIRYMSYSAVRICPESSAPEWWSEATRRRDAPPALLPLLRGRRRVELTPDEAATVLAWAGTIDGWTAAEPKPLFVHQPA